MVGIISKKERFINKGKNIGKRNETTIQEQAELEDGLNDLYLEWQDEQMMRDFKDEAEDLIRKVIEQEDFVFLFFVCASVRSFLFLGLGRRLNGEE